jgi:phosphate transport system substrate-binding protein
MSQLWIKSAKLCGVLSGLIMLIGCDSGQNDNGGEGKVTELKGKIVVDGSSTVAPITEAARGRFQDTYPNVTMPIKTSGTGGGFKKFVTGETDISNASRPINDKEFDLCKTNGIEFYEIPIAYDGITFAVHNDNSWVKDLTVEQLQKMFTDNTGPDGKQKYRNWNDIDPSWPEKPIKFYIPGTNSGTFDYFKEVIIGEGAIRSDVATNEDDNSLIQLISGDEYGIGFFGVAYYVNNSERIKAIPIINPNTNKPVMPTDEDIETGNYAPFSRPLFIYVSKKSAAKSYIVRFVEMYIDQGAEIAGGSNYVGLPAEIYTQAKKNFRDKKTGTYFLTEDGQKREGSLVEIYKESNRLQ